MHMVLMVLPGIAADKQQPQSRQRGDARHPLRSAPVGTCSSPVACAYFFRHSSGGRSGFFALLGRWCFESSRVAKDTSHWGSKRWRSARRKMRSRPKSTPGWLAPHQVFEGNCPSNTILAERLTPETLGLPVALYEHSAFTQGTIWNIDSFDQMGRRVGRTPGGTDGL